MDHIRRVVIGLGSNLGDRAANLNAAIGHLRADRELRVLRRSAIYQSPPAGGPPQGDYLNAAVLLVTALEARSILERALAIEQAMGRVRSPEERWGPRPIDLDILWIEGEWIDEAGLTVPHPRLAERPFALRPLLDVAPDASDAAGNPFASCPAAAAPLERLAD